VAPTILREPGNRGCLTEQSPCIIPLRIVGLNYSSESTITLPAPWTFRKKVSNYSRRHQADLARRERLPLLFYGPPLQIIVGPFSRIVGALHLHARTTLHSPPPYAQFYGLFYWPPPPTFIIRAGRHVTYRIWCLLAHSPTGGPDRDASLVSPTGPTILMATAGIPVDGLGILHRPPL